MASIRFESVEKRYAAGTHVLRGFSLEVEHGELVVLVGPSGCGKSTTLRLLAGLEDPTAGTIQIDGVTVNRMAPKDRDVAMVFQSYALYPHLTVYENIAFGLQLRKVARDVVRRRVEETAKTLGLDAVLNRRPAFLSGGQRQRVALGRAMVREPRCFLFDEPLSNLDPRLRVDMRAELKRLHQTLGATMLYVTHDQEEAMTLADRLVVLDGGVIAQSGTPLDVYTRPANRFVATFIGSPPMNLLPGMLVARDGHVWFDDGAQAMALPRSLAERAESGIGRSILLGVRPQAVSPAEPGDSTSTLDATVSLLEPLGAELDVRMVTTAGAPLVARVPARQPWALSERRTLAFAPEGLHLFDVDSGRALGA